MVQIHLGGVELPHDKEFGHLKREIACEKTAIFDRLNRLVRCVVDCKAFDGDGIGTRVGLELARAVAANSWENKPTQLNQIPGFGPVTVRRWISHGVHTVLGVADRDFLEMERISGRNPPYGKNLSTTLEKFPRLTLKAELMELPKQDSCGEGNVSIVVKAHLGHRNTKHAPSWNNKVPAVTFMVEVSDGSLAYFWRGNIKKLNADCGLELSFPVMLSGPAQVISCYFSCEEIVGTQIVKTFEPQIPASAFTCQARAQMRHRGPPKLNLLDSDLDFEDVEDADMLDVLNSANLNSERASPSDYLGPPDTVVVVDDDDDDGFPLIDDLIAKEPLPTTTTESRKMENGKWMCHHHCRNGAPTKSGKPCSHRCCHEGLDKPRPPPQRRKPMAIDEKDLDEDSAIQASQIQQQNINRGTSSEGTHNRRPGLVKPKSTSSVNDEGVGTGLEGKPKRPKSQIEGSEINKLSKKRTRLFDNENNENIASSSRKRSVRHWPSLEDVFLDDADYIDLTVESDKVETGESTKAHKNSIRESGKGKKRLGELHHGSQDNVKNLAGLPKSYKNKAHKLEGACSPESRMSYLNDENGDTRYDDIFSDDYEFPDVEELIRPNHCHDTRPTRVVEESDETLYPGVVNTLKESLEYG